MRPLPRILVLIGSGETTPSMAPIHRSILGRFPERPVPATFLDTPYGFEENAAELSTTIGEYFANRLGNPISVASFRADGDPLERQTALGRVREAAYVFSGPGSPSYALRHWAGSEIPALLADKLATGGAVVTASAAALTLGRLTVPVYEIYKVGEDPRWLPGLDLLSAFGLPVAVIPHFDNGEGRHHDTRYCYLGERRLRQLEEEMPDDTFMLGIDEHTSLSFDLDAGRASVRGRGGVTVRRHGTSTVFQAGADPTINDLRAAAFAGRPGTMGAEGSRPDHPVDRSHQEPIADRERTFREALDRRDYTSAAGTVLALDEVLSRAGRPISTLEDLDGRIALRSMIVHLAEAAEAVLTERADLVGPLVDALVEVRLAARVGQDWDAADGMRDRLRSLGDPASHDSADGTTWSIANRS